MMIKMIQAVSDMLVYTDDASFKIRVECAKVILDKVIEGIKDKEVPSNVTPIPQEKFKPKEINPNDQYLVVVGDVGELTQIKNLPPDSLIDMDGAVLMHRDAIGKKFQNITIL